MSAAKLSVAGLDAAYGRAQMLFDVSLEVGAGEAVALLGRNGAGKSTTFRAILGLDRPPQRRGSFSTARTFRSCPPYEIVRRGLGYVPEDRRIFSDLTVEENLLVGRQPPRPNAPTWTPERLFAIFPNLRELRGRAGARMSGGEQQMLTIARTLMGNPSLSAARRAVRGPRAEDRRADDRGDPRNEARGPEPFGQRAEPRISRASSPSASMSSRKARIRFAGTMAEFDARPDIRDAYLAF